LVYLWALTYPDLVKLANEKGGIYQILSLGRTEITEEGEQRATSLAKLMGLIGIPTALATHGYTGFLFSVISAHPLWSTPIMPILFLSSAVVSGAALLSMIVILTDSMEKAEDTIPAADWSTLILTFLFIDGLLLMTEFITVMLADVEEHVTVWAVLISGDLWFAFWILELLLGFWVPLIILLVPQLRTDRRAVFLAGFLVVIGVFAKRMNLIVGGQLITSLTGQLTTYSPSFTELLISIGGIAAVSFFFFVAWKILPLGRKSSSSKLQEVS
jgi:molybdopterin-containing oxidoreductase family membrane subunit